MYSHRPEGRCQREDGLLNGSATTSTVVSAPSVEFHFRPATLPTRFHRSLDNRQPERSSFSLLQPIQPKDPSPHFPPAASEGKTLLPLFSALTPPAHERAQTDPSRLQ